MRIRRLLYGEDWQPAPRLLGCVLLCLLTACTAGGTVSPAGTDSGPASLTLASSTAPAYTPAASSTASQQSTPTATPLLAFAYPLQSVEWPATGDLRSDLGKGTEIVRSIDSLAPGDYLLLMDPASTVVSAFALGTQDVDDVLRLPPLEYVGAQLVTHDGDGTLALGVFPRSWLVFDLADARAWGVVESCNGIPPHRLSPDGRRIAGMCEDFIQMPDAAIDHVVMEVLSVAEGKGKRFAIPRSPNQRDRPLLTWLDDNHVLVSQVWVQGEFRTCSVSLDLGTMFCPPLGLNGMTISSGHFSPESGLVILVEFGTGSTVTLVPRQCFDPTGLCEGIEQVRSEIARGVIASSDPDRTWWLEAEGPGPTREVGLTDLRAGEFQQIASVSGDWLGRALCPDASCMFLFQIGSGENWRLNLDGSLQALPFAGDLIVGSFEVP